MTGKRFPKSEKLKSRKAIEHLIGSGRREQTKGLVLLWSTGEHEDPKVLVRAAFSVPKKRIPKAVDRNLLKRRLREAFRLNRDELMKSLSSDNIHLDLMFIYQENSVIPFREAEVKLVLLLNELRAKVHEGSS